MPSAAQKRFCAKGRSSEMVRIATLPSLAASTLKRRAEAAQMQRLGAQPDEVQRVANTMRTNAARDGDAPMRRLMQLANDIDVLGEPRTLEQQLARIEAVTAADLRALLASHPINGEGMLVSVGPADWPR